MADADKLRNANPWHPITDSVDLKHLGKFLEELNECIDAAAWALTYGAGDTKLWQEIADVNANLALVTGRFSLCWEGRYHQPCPAPDDDEVLKTLIMALSRCGCAVSRVIIQGIDECEPVTAKPNRLWLEESAAAASWAVSATIVRFGFDVEAIKSRAEKKINHLRQWHAFA